MKVKIAYGSDTAKHIREGQERISTAIHRTILTSIDMTNAYISSEDNIARDKIEKIKAKINKARVLLEQANVAMNKFEI